ncbi:maleylpyruvate isomerase N-terminal domain-containing protein [Sphaerisporangium sp. NPDC088356]|uniref:maleylpyruvate isomerase N-terminal domain-containing protein n=1 Tax=Sphaerisporangium sp. NPDC088356 TaxID=3154871 RepID=UPI0034245F3B
MVTPITRGQWEAVRTSLREAGDRFAEMVSSAREPHAKATRDWTVVESAAHVASITRWYSHMLRFDDGPHPFPTLEGALLATTVDTVSDVNDVALELFPERDPRTLAHLLRTYIGEILRVTEGLDPARPVVWLGDSRVPLAGVLAHLVNELLVHGWDIASATRTRWVMPPREAALFFDLFLVGMIQQDVGRLLDTGEPALDRRIAVQFHSRYTTPVTLVLRGGRVSSEAPGRDTDVHLYFDPAALNLLLFGRIGRTRAVATGKLAVWGRRPWLLPAFLRTVRLPTNARPRSTQEPAGA